MVKVKETTTKKQERAIQREFNDRRKKNLEIAIALGFTVVSMKHPGYNSTVNQYRLDNVEHIRETLDGRLFWDNPRTRGEEIWDPVEDDMCAAELALRFHIGFTPVFGGKWKVTNEFGDHQEVHEKFSEAFIKHVCAKNPSAKKKVNQFEKLSQENMGGS